MRRKPRPSSNLLAESIGWMATPFINRLRCHGAVLAAEGYLAKLVVLQTSYDDLYARIVQNPSFLREIEDAARGRAKAIVPPTISRATMASAYRRCSRSSFAYKGASGGRAAGVPRVGRPLRPRRQHPQGGLAYPHRWPADRRDHRAPPTRSRCRDI